MALRLPCLLAPLAAVLLSACDVGLSESGEVAARVNGHTVPMQRLQQLEQWAAAQAAGVDRGSLLRGLVDRELMAQHAAELRLDRTPLVRAALDEARSEALARAYVDSLLPAQPADSPEVRDFYYARPELFRERQRFQLLELATSVDGERLDELRDQAARASGLHDVARWLDARGLAYRAGGTSRTSDALAPELLAAVASLREGGIAVIAAAGRASIVQLLGRQPAPLSLEEARPLIAALLRESRRADVAAREARELRALASIQTIALGPAREDR
jgi:EpsD family peptidyl-prolyl cis-trans isomerase